MSTPTTAHTALHGSFRPSTIGRVVSLTAADAAAAAVADASAVDAAV